MTLKLPFVRNIYIFHLSLPTLRGSVTVASIGRRIEEGGRTFLFWFRGSYHFYNMWGGGAVCTCSHNTAMSSPSTCNLFLHLTKYPTSRLSLMARKEGNVPLDRRNSWEGVCSDYNALNDITHTIPLCRWKNVIRTYLRGGQNVHFKFTLLHVMKKLSFGIRLKLEFLRKSKTVWTIHLVPALAVFVSHQQWMSPEEILAHQCFFSNSP